MGPGLLGGFPRALSAVGFADLGKRWRRAAFRADSACETAQKLWAGFAGCKGWGGCQRVCLAREVSRARTGDDGTFISERASVPVHVRLQSHIAAACAPDAW